MTAPHILLLEDEGALARAITRRLRRDGYSVAACETLSGAKRAAQSQRPDLLVLDLRLPDGHGLEFLEWLRGEIGAVPAIVMTAFGDIDDAITAMRLGAVDFLKKPLDLDALCRIASDALHRPAPPKSGQTGAMPDTARPAVIGDSEAMASLRTQCARIAELGSGEAPPNVLITGETGTGKDLIARVLHGQSPRGEAQFVQVDCAALPRDLIEAELFGHEKGAFTNAHRARRGLLAAAGKGTAFLNEIGELPLALQSKLLTVLESRTMREIGSDNTRKVGAWFVAATNRDLEPMMAAGDFRQDLFYRLNVLTLHLPPLRERDNDVVMLAQHFVTETAGRYQRSIPHLTAAACDALQAYDWPGNVRELRHVIERAVLVNAGDVLDAEHLRLPALRDENGLAASQSQPVGDTLVANERDLIARTLATTGDNISEAARRLGLSRGSLRYRLEKYGLLRDKP